MEKFLLEMYDAPPPFFHNKRKKIYTHLESNKIKI